MEIDAWINDIKYVSEEVRKLSAELSAESLNWQPGPDQWSIAQVLEHLMVVNKSYHEIPVEIKNNTYKKPLLGRINWIVNLFGKLILQSVQPEESRKSQTFPIWKPTHSDYPITIVDQFFTSQNSLIEWINEHKDLIGKNPVVSSPANRNIVYRFNTLIEIIVSHEKRHLQQINRVFAALP